MKWLHKLIISIVVFSTVACDQSTKVAARSVLKGKGIIPVINDFFLLHYVENEGAFLSLGASWPPYLRFILLVLVSLGVLIVVFVYMIKDKNLSTLQITALSFVTGGGIGNLIDRIIFQGQVTDFMNMGIGNLRTGIFNFADFFIMAGCGLFLVSLLRGKRPADERGENSAAD